MGAREPTSRTNLRSETSVKSRAAPQLSQAALMQRPLSPSGPNKIRHNNLFPAPKNMAVYAAYNGSDDAAQITDSIDTVEAPFKPSERAVSNPRPGFSDSQPLSMSTLGHIKSASKLPPTKLNQLGLQQFKANIASLRGFKIGRDGRNE